MASRPELAYRAAVAQVRARLEQFARARFAAGQFHDDELARFVAVVVPVVLAGQRQVSALTDAYLAQQLTAALGRRIVATGALEEYPRGADPELVYGRPYVTVRTKLAEGRDLQAAVSAGLARVSDLVLTDMQLAKTHTARALFARTPGVTGYRRVLSGGKSCALCYVASTQRYRTNQLMPIHPGCDCSVSVIIGGDGERVIDSDRLAATHEAVAERFGTSDAGGRGPVDYRKALIVREHGELGPVLTVKSDHFVGPSAI